MMTNRADRKDRERSTVTRGQQQRAQRAQRLRILRLQEIERNKKAWKERAERLRLIRLLSNKGKSEFAIELHMSKQRWDNYETGKRKFDIELALNLCERVNLPLEWIYFGKDESLKDKDRAELRKLQRQLRKRKDL